jgi:glycosyltransferase involved in cell wall biosynthesis
LPACLRPLSQWAQAIEELCDSPERRQAMGENARAYVARHHSKEELTALYGETLEAVANMARGREVGSEVSAGPYLNPDP